MSDDTFNLKRLKEENERLKNQVNDLSSMYQFSLEFFSAHAAVEKKRRRHGDAKRLEVLRAAVDYSSAFEEEAPLVSVIIPSYQRAKKILEKALPSVVSQDYKNWELIIVGDAMEEEGAERLRGIKDHRVRFYNLKHRGFYPELKGPKWYVAGTRPVNFGLRMAQGRWITHLDDDDEFTATHISSLLKTAKEKRVEWVHGKVMFVTEDAGPNMIIGDKIPAQGKISRISSLYHSGLKQFKYNIACWRYFYPGDWDLWERFLEMGVSHAHLPQLVGIHHGNIIGERDRGKNNASRSNDLPGEKESGTNAEPTEESSYQRWVAKKTLQEIDGQLFAERMMLKWQSRPTIHLILVLQAEEKSLLADTIDSLSAQMYKNWRLTVLADFPSPDRIFDELEALEWLQVNEETNLYGSINQAIKRGKADWVALVNPGIRFTPQLLFTCVDYINIRPKWRLIYTDEDMIDAEGRRSAPKFKPDFNLDMLRSMPYFGGFCLVRRHELEQFGGYDALPGAENYDLAFKILDHYNEGVIGHIADVLYHLPSSREQQPDEAVGRIALINHLQRNQIAAEVRFGTLAGTYRVIYQHDTSPLVSIIIPTKDKLEIFQPCIESLLEKTTYDHYEVIVVDNNSSDPDTLDFYHDLEMRHSTKIKILRYSDEFNFSAICNFGAREAKGEYLVMLNNDTEVIQGEWLDRMMVHGQRNEVGAVGARLIYPETHKIQHAGVILGISGVASHPYNGLLGINDPGYMGRTQIDQNFSAVTAACLLVRKSIYEAVGGMDEENLKVLFNDVDLCLKVIQHSLKVVWTPYATLSHHGSQTLKSESIDVVKMAPQVARSRKEVAFMRKKWLPLLANDPAYNPQLSLVNLDFRVESHVVVNWDNNFHDRPRIFGLPLSFGSGEYRVISPCRALNTAAIAYFDFVQPVKADQVRILEVSELQRTAPDTLLLQNAISDAQIDALRLYKENHHALRVFALDDLLTQLPEKNSFYRKVFRDAKPRLRKALSYCDRLIVSTEPLADLCRNMIGDIRVIPNRLEKTKWCHLISKRRQGKKPRVGWVGAQQHQGDLELIISVVKETAAEVDWIFMGMCLDELRPYVKEIHDFVVSFDDYPAKVASLNLDLAVAPLEMNPFNEAKSNLRLLEYGIFGWPVVCTDIFPYQNAPVKRVQNNPKNWKDAILERTRNLDATAIEGDILKKWVMKNYLLEDHLDPWVKALLR
ncbi:MAG: glycosyltransferase [Nitrospiria bacterium]